MFYRFTSGQKREWKPFVHNRVNKISKLVQRGCWSHCPGKENPADRGLNPLELSVNTLWRHGPQSLSNVGDVENTLIECQKSVL